VGADLTLLSASISGAGGNAPTAFFSYQSPQFPFHVVANFYRSADTTLDFDPTVDVPLATVAVPSSDGPASGMFTFPGPFAVDPSRPNLLVAIGSSDLYLELNPNDNVISIPLPLTVDVAVANARWVR